MLLSGHHETPPEAHTKILEKFPDNFPRVQGNVIPPTTEKKAEEVCYVWAVCIFASHDSYWHRSPGHDVEGEW